MPMASSIEGRTKERGRNEARKEGVILRLEIELLAELSSITPPSMSSMARGRTWTVSRQRQAGRQEVQHKADRKSLLNASVVQTVKTHATSPGSFKASTWFCAVLSNYSRTWWIPVYSLSYHHGDGQISGSQAAAHRLAD